MELGCYTPSASFPGKRAACTHWMGQIWDTDSVWRSWRLEELLVPGGNQDTATPSNSPQTGCHAENTTSAAASCTRGQLKCDGTRAETRYRLSARRTSPFKSSGASVQSSTGSRGVLISCNNAGYTVFRGSVKSTGYPLHSPVSPSFPLLCITMFHHISTGLYSILLLREQSSRNVKLTNQIHLKPRLKRQEIQRNFEMLSRNNCSMESNKYYTFSVCVSSLSYPACKAHAPYHIVICGLTGSTIFFHIIS